MGTPVQARKATLEIKRGEGDFELIDGITDVTFNPTLSTADVSHHGSGGKRQKLPDWIEYDFDFSGVYMDDDDGQEDLFDAIEGHEICEFRYRPLGDVAGATQKVFSAIPTGRPTEHPNEGGATFSGSGEVTGTVVTTAIPAE